MSRPACAASIGGCRRRSTGSSPTTCRSWLFAPTPTAVDNLRAEGITRGVVLVGDLMQDLAARVGREVATAEALAAASRAPGLDHGRPGPHARRLPVRDRASRREPPAGGAPFLGGPPRSGRPAGPAGDPGDPSRDPARAGARGHRAVAGDIRLVDPQGYRTSLTLQLHAAAVVTDSGGVQRESAWLGVPCLVLRDATEWVEAVAGSGGRMVIVGLDAALAERALAGLAPPDGSASAGPRACRRLRPGAGRRRRGHRRGARGGRNDRGSFAPCRDVRVQRRQPRLAGPARGEEPGRGRPPGRGRRPADAAPTNGRSPARRATASRSRSSRCPTSGAAGGTGSGSRGTCAASSSAASCTTSAAARPAGSAPSPISAWRSSSPSPR